MKVDDKTRQHAIAYLKARYWTQELSLFFGLQTYVNANLGYVLKNIENGHHKCGENCRRRLGQ